MTQAQNWWVFLGVSALQASNNSPHLPAVMSLYSWLWTMNFLGELLLPSVHMQTHRQGQDDYSKAEAKHWLWRLDRNGQRHRAAITRNDNPLYWVVWCLEFIDLTFEKVRVQASHICSQGVIYLVVVQNINHDVLHFIRRPIAKDLVQ